MGNDIFDNRVVLVTGGTGSFGNAAARHFLANTKAREIRVVSRDEAKQEDMRKTIGSPRITFMIGDVRDTDAVDAAMDGVDFVFHAAALKQVPSCEFFPIEAVNTNVIGSGNVIRAAFRHKVKRVVCLSTDKAVQPINAMGMTKALMEKVAMSYARQRAAGDTVVACVRYGNVLCSRGSVVPLFIQQIKAGKPITVTDPQMTRFLLPMPHAIDLVEYCLANAEPGDIYVRKAVACTVGDLAAVLKEMFAADIPIETIGVRHGEKIYETLLTAQERAGARDEGLYWRLPNDTRDLNYDQYFSIGSREVAQIEDYTSHNTERLDRPALKALLLSLPEVRAELTRSGS
jgi:UDP-N-acetylglucosamine 4,6-dehydratase/5-epimerase